MSTKAEQKRQAEKDLQRAILKTKALRASELALKHKLERIDFRLDYIEPEIEELKAAAGRGVVPEFKVKVLLK